MADRPLISEVTWDEPPEPRRKYDWDSIADKLMAKPYEWGKVFDWDRTSVANAIRQGSIRALHPDLGFETRTSHNTRKPVRMCTLHARWNPEAVKDELRTQVRRKREA